MKTLHITISHAGSEPLEYDGLFASVIDAITDALDRAAAAFGESARVGIRAHEVAA